MNFRKILEIGCADGNVLKKVSNELNPDVIIGMDVSRKYLLIAKTQLSNADFIVADAEYIPFKIKSFDLVILSDIIEHVEKPNDLLQEVKRISINAVFNIPIEKCLKNIFENNSISKGGHLHSWNEKSALHFLMDSKLIISNYVSIIVPDNLRLHSYRYNRFGRFKSIFIIVDKIIYRFSKNIYSYIFGSNLFTFCRCPMEQ